MAPVATSLICGNAFTSANVVATIASLVVAKVWATWAARLALGAVMIDVTTTEPGESTTLMLLASTPDDFAMVAFALASNAARRGGLAIRAA